MLPVLSHLALHLSLGSHRSLPVCPSRMLAFRSLRHCRTLSVFPHLALHLTLSCYRSWPVCLSQTLAFRPLRH